LNLDALKQKLMQMFQQQQAANTQQQAAAQAAGSYAGNNPNVSALPQGITNLRTQGKQMGGNFMDLIKQHLGNLFGGQ